MLLEAMVCGTAMAGFGNEGYLNVVKAPWTEYFPKPKNCAALTAKIEKLYLNPDIRQAMSSWGISEAKKYEWQYIINEVLKVYEKALGK